MAGRDKSSTGWFYGLGISLFTSELDEIMNCLLTLTNVSDINDAVFTLVYILEGLVAYHLFDNKPFILVTIEFSTTN
nr:transposase [Spirosoma spitsbergense]